MPADHPATPIVPDPDDIPPRPPRRRGFVGIVVVVIVAAVIAIIWYWTHHTPASERAPGGDGKAAAASKAKGGKGGGRFGGDTRTVLPVAIAPARTADFVVWQNALGNVNARNTVTVRPRVDGQLTSVQFREGQMVKAGELLAQIDPKPFEVQVAQAAGQMARDQAQLANARIDLERYQTLLKQDSIAQQQVDTQAALVRQLEGTIEADRGAVDNAKLQLSYTRIVAPLAGRTGLRQVDPGNMVRQTDTNGIVVITQVQPISVLYSIPEEKLPAVVRRMQAGDAPVVEAWDRDGRNRLATGKLVTVDNQIDPTTGTIKLKAEFANENTALFPNQFVNVRMQLETLKGVTVVPSSAVQRGSPGTFVYRVNDDDTVSVRVVKLGPAQGETTVIEEGIAPGERVVTDGTDKLRDGAKIEPVTAEERAAQSAAPARAKGNGQGPRNGKGAAGAGAAPVAPSSASTTGAVPVAPPPGDTTRAVPVAPPPGDTTRAAPVTPPPGNTTGAAAAPNAQPAK